MRLLALDTSTWWGGLALVETLTSGALAETVALLEVRVQDSHAAHLLDRVDRLLADAGWAESSLDGFAATRGPGSFTGIRVALGTLRGLELATGRPAAGVTTLEALAEAHGPAEAARWVVLDAGRGELYASCFDAAGHPPQEIAPPRLIARDALFGIVGARGVVVPGPATVLDAGSAAGSRVAATPAGVAAAAGRLALERLERGEIGTLAPLYVRPPDALLGRRP